MAQQQLNVLMLHAKQLELKAQSALDASKAAETVADESKSQAKIAAVSAEDRLKVAEANNAPRIWDRWLKAFGFQTKRILAWETATLSARLARAEANDILRHTVAQHTSAKHERNRRQEELEALKTVHSEESSLLNQRIQNAEQQIVLLEALVHSLKDQLHIFDQTIGTLPNDDFFARPFEDQHRESAWVTATFEVLRSKLFLAALHLHEMTLKACKTKAIPNLRIVKAMLAGNPTEPILAEHRSLVWDMLFFTVPVVSSSLASFGRLFDGLGKESLGWLLIDEAGQATPQSVAGALWRSRRAVVIGDPMQVEPVVTVPSAIVRELRRRHNVNVDWSPLTESAQTIADHKMNLGAYINDSKQLKPQWTGLPLRAHRRCIDPMFSVSNAIAYGGQMVQANTKPGEIGCVLRESAWFDVEASSSDHQVIKEELHQLSTLIHSLKRNWPRTANNKPANIYVLSPFRKVANACKEVVRKEGPFPGRLKIPCGTVHTFQGKEAEIVILVLGSAPGSRGQGSRAWAAAKPNLLNVAITRAKLRLYVIGNAQDWGQCSFFNTLLQGYAETNQIIKSS